VWVLHDPNLTSLRSVEEDLENSAHAQLTSNKANDDSSNLARLSEGLFEISMDQFPQQTRRTCMAPLGDPLITAVHHTGVFDLKVLYCICPNSSDRGEWLLQSKMFPSSIKNIKTVFTFSVLDDFLIENLECKLCLQSRVFREIKPLENPMEC
jgi:hypothetical protein